MKTPINMPGFLSRLARHAAATVLVTTIFAASTVTMERNLRAQTRLAETSPPAAAQTPDIR